MVVVPALSAHSVRVVQDRELPLLLHLLIVLGRVRGVEDQVLEWGGGAKFRKTLAAADFEKMFFIYKSQWKLPDLQ